MLNFRSGTDSRKRDGRNPQWKPTRTWKGNINISNNRVMYEDVDWIQLA
jgi:hypothetical protein